MTLNSRFFFLKFLKKKKKKMSPKSVIGRVLISHQKYLRNYYSVYLLPPEDFNVKRFFCEKKRN